jgi:protein TonB
MDSASPSWLASAPPPPDRRTRKIGRALGVSVAAHAGFAMLLVIAMSVRSTPVDTKAPPVRLNAVYLPLPDPMGGGGGNPGAASPRPVEVPRHEMPQPVPIAPAPVVAEPPKDPVIDVALETNAAKMLQAAGVGTISVGPGGGGRGPGAGPGDGPGLGPGTGGNEGGGPRRPGGDVTAPTLIRSVDPRYTNEALIAKLAGTVELEAVVLANGTVGPVRVTQSLDAVHGLDQEALIAARQWLFRPGTQQGRPVDVIVKLVIAFHIR